MSNKKNKSVRVNKVVLTHAKQPPKEFFVPGESAAQVQKALEEKLPHHKVTVIPQGRGRVDVQSPSYYIDDVEFNIQRDGKTLASFSNDDLRNTKNSEAQVIKETSLSFLQSTCAKPLKELEKKLEKERQDSPYPEDHPEWLED